MAVVDYLPLKSTRFTVSRWSRTSGLAGSSAGQAHLQAYHEACGLLCTQFIRLHSKPLGLPRMYAQFCLHRSMRGFVSLSPLNSTGSTVSRWAGLPYMCRPRRTAGSSAGRPPRGACSFSYMHRWRSKDFVFAPPPDHWPLVLQ